MTTMKPSILAAVAVLALAAAGGVATAQTAQSPQTTRAGGNVSDQPVMVGADGGELTETGFALNGRAEVTQGQNRLRADAITGVRSNGAVTRVTATGNVYYVTPTETIRGDRAEYNVSTATIVISGDVILTQGRNVLTGARLTYNTDTGTANMDGGSNTRIQGVFYPQGATN